MSDNVAEVFFGKTKKVTLADGKEYKLREPDLDALIELDLGNANMNDVKNIKKMATVMLDAANEGIDKERIGKLITVSMLRDGSEFLTAMYDVLGVVADKKADSPNE